MENEWKIYGEISEMGRLNGQRIWRHLVAEFRLPLTSSRKLSVFQFLVVSPLKIAGREDGKYYPATGWAVFKQLDY